MHIRSSNRFRIRGDGQGRINGKALAGILMILFFILFSLFGNLIGPGPDMGQDYDLSLRPPSLSHPFGTDLLGRDMYARAVTGGRISLLVGFLSIAVSLLIGLPLGAIAGYYGGWIDTIIMRLADIFLSMPTILGALLIMALIGPGLINILIVFAMLGWAYIARLFRSSVISIKNSDFVLSAIGIGASGPRVILRHIAPNSVGPVLLFALMNIGTAILAESVLSFLGVGLQPPAVSWGYLLSESVTRYMVAPWLMYFPGALLTLSVIGFTLMGEGARAAFDPKERDE